MIPQIIICSALFLVPVIQFIMAAKLKKKPAKEINKYVGYRSKLSMASQEAWDYANMRMADYMFKGAVYSLILGVVCTAILLILRLPVESKAFIAILTIGIVGEALLATLPTMRIEKELKDELYKK